MDKVLACPSQEVVWRWSFQAAGYPIESDEFQSEAEATAELRKLQAKLYPGWEDEGQRRKHLERLQRALKEERQHAETLQEPSMQAFARQVGVVPEDFRVEGEALRNPFPGFRNLGNTCYLNAVARCP